MAAAALIGACQSDLEAVSVGEIFIASYEYGTETLVKISVIGPQDEEPRPLLHFGDRNVRGVSQSPDGSKIAFVDYHSDHGHELYVMNIDGSEQKKLASLAGGSPVIRWSPDGEQISYWDEATPRSGDAATDEVFVVAADGETQTQQITKSGADACWRLAASLTWSPNSAEIAFRGCRVIGTERSSDGFPFPVQKELKTLAVMNADGTDERRLLFDDYDVEYTVAWSPDATKIAYISENDFTSSLSVVGVDGEGRVELLNDGGFAGFWIDVWSPVVWSPDGTRLAHFLTEYGGNWLERFLDKDRDGRILSVIHADNPDLRWTKSVSGGTKPVWSPDGRQIAFSAYRYRYPGAEIVVIDADGNNLRKITDNNTHDYVLSWSRREPTAG